MSADYDLIIKNGVVIDGTGMPRRRVDVAINDGRVVRMAKLHQAVAKEEIDATGMIVAPGIVDPHTHYDPQITFDPYATMSCFHGVTTVLAGNCGFSVAPTTSETKVFVESIFAKVEEMDPAALGGVEWDACSTFPEFLASRRDKLGVNFASYVGHSNIRLAVMGADALEREATDAEIGEMQAMLREALQAGASGLSSSAAPTHLDMEGRPVPSRFASERELLALADEMGRWGAGSICFLPQSAIGGLNDADKELLIEIGRRSGVPVIIQGIGGRDKTDAPTASWDASQKFLDRAVEQGAPVYSLLPTRPFDRTVIFGEGNAFYPAVPSWHKMGRLAPGERAALLRDPAAREEMREAVENYNRDPVKGTTLPPPNWQTLFVDDTALPQNEPLIGHSVAALAAERGVKPGDFVLDLILEENFQTTFRWRTETEDWTNAVLRAMSDPRMIVGTSDGGAHLGKDDQADFSSFFLRTWVLDRKAWTLEEGIRQLTQIPAALLGFSDRGTLKVGGWADLMIFDPETIGPWRKEFSRELPGGAGRYKAYGKGIKATVVNGVPIVLDGELTGRLPGHVVAPN